MGENRSLAHGIMTRCSIIFIPKEPSRCVEQEPLNSTFSRTADEVPCIVSSIRTPNEGAAHMVTFDFQQFLGGSGGHRDSSCWVLDNEMALTVTTSHQSQTEVQKETETQSTAEADSIVAGKWAFFLWKTWLVKLVFSAEFTGAYESDNTDGILSGGSCLIFTWHGENQNNNKSTQQNIWWTEKELSGLKIYDIWEVIFIKISSLTAFYRNHFQPYFSEQALEKGLWNLLVAHQQW